jgi:radical SAM superfamily enzyme YgiQ (UPF0313 family)
MPAASLAEVCRHSYALFPRLQRITVYGSSQYLCRKGLAQLRDLAAAGLGRIHVGVESGDDHILAEVQKGATARDHILAGGLAREAGIEVNAYVILGIGGQDRTREHIRETVRVLDEMQPAVVRLRTFVPKMNTPLLADVLAGRFQMLTPHQALRETLALLESLRGPVRIASDHYTNYLQVGGRLPEDRDAMLHLVQAALNREEASFRPFFIGTQ